MRNYKKEQTYQFELVKHLAEKDFIIDLKLCSVLLENNKLYPWIFLVPRVPNVKNMTFLSMEEKLKLMREIALCEDVMTSLFNPTQTNIAMIGNKTPQLHIHVICRFDNDPMWPNTVWNTPGEPYDVESKANIIKRLKDALGKQNSLTQYAND